MKEVPLMINQIFRGIAPSQYFGVEGTYLSSIAVDPDFPISSSDVKTSGFCVPVGYAKFSGSNITGPVIREITSPKDNNIWTVQTNGKIVIFDKTLTTETLIGTVAGSNASWGDYYNNYIYVFGTGTSKNDVSRIGPLNTLPYNTQTVNFTVGATLTGATSGATATIIGDVDAGASGTLTLTNINGIFTSTETITDSSGGSAKVNRTFASLITDGVWTGATLGSQTALTNTTYPSLRGVAMPNHVGFAHGDGSYYFCDFKNGTGMLHRINTYQVTNEGDTNGTTVPTIYNALDFPFGFYPTWVTNLGTSLMIGGIYTVDTTTNQGKSAFFLWDPTDTVSFYLGPVYLPDPLTTAGLNFGGTVHIWSGNASNGVRLQTYQGGPVTQDVVYQEEGLPPLAGAVDALGNRVVWGGFTTNPAVGGAVWAWGSKDSRLGKGLHHICKTSDATGSPFVTALRYIQQASNVSPKVVPAWTTGSTYGIDKYSSSATLASIIRFMFNVGQKFEIKSIRVPLAGAVDSNTTITPTVYLDDLSSSTVLDAINNTNYSAERKVMYSGAQLKNTTAKNNIVLEFAWTGTTPLPVGLPIKTMVKVFEDE